MQEKGIQQRINKIFLIGNGFDLAHNLPTSYQDFIKWYLKESSIKAIEKGRYDDDFINVEIDIFYFKHNYIDINKFIEDLFLSGDYINNIKPLSSRPRRSNMVDFEIYIKSPFFLKLINNCLTKDWGGIEDEIYREIIKNHNNLLSGKLNISVDKKAHRPYNDALVNIQTLNKTVNFLKTILIEYLKLHNEPAKLRSELFSSRNNDWGYNYITKESHPNGLNRKVLFLNFNYTTYLDDKIKKVVHDQVDDVYTFFETIQIHGDINGDLDNVIFGVGDENKEFYSEIESLYDDDWLMSMKSFHYLRNESYQNLLGFIDVGDYEIFVIGHSCSITDRTLLNMLFENDACKKIHVYHYSGINSYLKTAYNIARNFNDKVRLRKVLQPFNEKLSTK